MTREQYLQKLAEQAEQFAASEFAAELGQAAGIETLRELTRMIGHEAARQAMEQGLPIVRKKIDRPLAGNLFQQVATDERAAGVRVLAAGEAPADGEEVLDLGPIREAALLKALGALATGLDPVTSRRLDRPAVGVEDRARAEADAGRMARAQRELARMAAAREAQRISPEFRSALVADDAKALGLSEADQKLVAQLVKDGAQLDQVGVAIVEEGWLGKATARAVLVKFPEQPPGKLIRAQTLGERVAFLDQYAARVDHAGDVNDAGVAGWASRNDQLGRFNPPPDRSGSGPTDAS